MDIESQLPEQIRSSYTIKIALAALLIVAAVVGMGLLTHKQVSDRVTDEQLDTMETNAELEARAIGEWIEGEKDSVRMLSKHHGITPSDRAKTRETLNAELQEMPEEADALYVVERNSNQPSTGVNETIIASTEPELEDNQLSVTNIKWGQGNAFAFADTNDVVISWVYKDIEEPSVAIASPTPDGEHILVAEYRTDVRAKHFTSEVEGTETKILGGTTGDVLFDVEKSNILTQYKGNAENTIVGQRILNTDPTADLNGSVLTETGVIGYHRVPGDVDWVVVKEAPRSNAMAVVQEVQRDLSILLAMTLLGFTLIGLMIHRGPIRSIKKLTTQANAIANGDLSVDIDDDGRTDEVGQVRDAFRNTKSYLETISLQAEALSNQEFDADVLSEDVPGTVGESIEIMHGDLERFITEIKQARKEAEVARAEAEEMANYLQEKAEEYSDIMQVVGAGDLTQRMSQDGQEEAMDRIAEEFNDMIEELEKTTGQLKSYVDEVEEAGSEVEQSASTVKEASEQVAYSIQKISDDASGQKERLQQITETLDEVIRELEAAAADTDDEDIAESLSNIQEIASAINEIAELSEQTMAESENVAGAAEEQAAELNGVSNRAADLQRYARPLRDILQRFDTEAEHEFVFSIGPSTDTSDSGADAE